VYNKEKSEEEGSQMYVIFDMDGVISDSEAVYLAGHGA